MQFVSVQAREGTRLFNSNEEWAGIAYSHSPVMKNTVEKEIIKGDNAGSSPSLWSYFFRRKSVCY